MSQLKLKPWQRRRLRQQLRAASDVRVYRRTLAMLELDRGRSAAEIAEMLGVSRQSVHNWATAFADDPDPSALRDRDRSGRPPVWDERAEGLLRSLMTSSPQESGYPDANWTVPLLRQELGRALEQMPSDETVRRGLHRLGYIWKRPRYALEPDPQREKKTADPAADPRPAEAQRGPGRGRDRLEAVPAAARRLVAAGRAGGGPAERRERQAGDLRGDEPEDGDAAVPDAGQGPQRRLPGVPGRGPPT